MLDVVLFLQNCHSSVHVLKLYALEYISTVRSCGRLVDTSFTLAAQHSKTRSYSLQISYISPHT